MPLCLLSALVRLRTVAEGLLSALAHDLEIETSDVSGEAEGPDGPVHLRVPVARLKVTGAVRKGNVVEGVLGPMEREEIERRMADAIGGEALVIEATLHATGDAKVARLHVQAPRGSETVQADVQRDTNENGRVEVRGACALSMRALGVGPVKGPLGAFRIKDEVWVTFEATFAPPEAGDA